MLIQILCRFIYFKFYSIRSRARCLMEDSFENEDFMWRLRRLNTPKSRMLAQIEREIDTH
jgi:hypothetical protein